MLDAQSISLGIYRSADPSAAFRSLAESLAAALPLQCALYVMGEPRAVRDSWPAGAEVSNDLLDTALHVPRPEVFPLGSEFPFDASQFPDADLLLLPLHRSSDAEAVGLFIAAAGSFGEDLQPWEEVAEALQDVEERHRRVVATEVRCAELKRRMEESESLHTLGLAANRTLNKDEVLNLVARFTRTLLGAHYVTVHTVVDGAIGVGASVGLRNPAALGADQSSLAQRVVAAEKPLTVGTAEARLRVSEFAFHEAEGMAVGLGIPLSLFGDTFGALIVGYRRDYAISPRDIRLALTLAGHAAVAISNARLHAAVEERSAQLARAYEELDALTRAKERFFASINHELRTPLNAILGYQGLLLDDAASMLPPENHAWLVKSQRAAETLLELVNDILDLAKLAEGKMSLEPRACAVGDIFEGALNTIQPLADQSGVSLSVIVARDLPEINTDPARVQQILVNLLSNAVKFADHGGVSLQARITSADPVTDGSAAAIEITVRDTGPGIGGDDLKRIFEEYEQVKGTKGGTGLGLPISRRLARALGGELLAESELGKGSTFTLRLPAGEAPSPDALSLEEHPYDDTLQQNTLKHH
jgi:signal transduction histidine kinase